MMCRAVLYAFCICLLFFGCTFSRSVVNPHHRRHDTSWIVPGRTTREEVVKRFGLPPATIDGRGGIREDSIRYLTSDEFTGRLEVGYIVTPTFERSHVRHQYDLLIRFDSNGVVSLVSRTESVDGENRLLEYREAP